jgi:hypothetical protein
MAGTVENGGVRTAKGEHGPIDLISNGQLLTARRVRYGSVKATKALPEAATMYCLPRSW